MKVAFLCNVSDRWKGRKTALLERLESVPQEKEIFTVDRNRADSIESHLKEVCEGNFDRIAVVGGDGTLNRAINFLRQRELMDRFSLGIVPFGTCNDFARHLGFRGGQVSNALKAVLGNNSGDVRLGRVNRRLFINNSGFGRKTSQDTRRGGALSALKAMSPHHLKAAWEGGTLEGDFLMMLCANAPYFSGGLHFSKSSSHTDDLLEFYFVRNASKLGLAARLILGRAGLPMSHAGFGKSVAFVQSRRLSLVLEPPAAFAADGERDAELESVREADFESGPRLRFLFP